MKAGCSDLFPWHPSQVSHKANWPLPLSSALSLISLKPMAPLTDQRPKVTDQLASATNQPTASSIHLIEVQ